MVDPERTSDPTLLQTSPTFPQRRGLLLNSPRPSQFLPQTYLVALRIYLCEPYHQPQIDRINPRRRSWVHSLTKSRAVGLPSLDHRLLARNFPGVTLETLRNSLRTPKTLCELSYVHLSTRKFLVGHRDGLHGITKRSDITIPRTQTEKSIILDSLRRRLRFPPPLRDTLLEQNILSPPPCPGEKGRCMALLAGH